MARRQLAALALGAALALAACSTDREVTRPEPEPVTTEALEGALIELDDLPDGFAAADAPAATIASEVIPEHACDDRLTDLAPEREASATFVREGRTLTSTVAWFPGQGSAVGDLLADVSEDCRQVVIDDLGLAIRTGPLDFGVLSDNTLPMRVEVEARTGPIEERDVILVREGDLVHVVRLTGPRPSDKELLDAVVRLAIGRLSELHLRTS